MIYCILSCAIRSEWHSQEKRERDPRNTNFSQEVLKTNTRIIVITFNPRISYLLGPGHLIRNKNLNVRQKTCFQATNLGQKSGNYSQLVVEVAMISGTSAESSRVIHTTRAFDMQASSTPVWCLLLAVIFSLRADGCERGSMDNWNFDNLRQFLKENKTSAFRKEAELRRGLKAPNLQDLTNMFNAIDVGKIPQYMKVNKYKTFGNSTGNFSISNGNAGRLESLLYGTFQVDGKTATHSTLEFSFVQGKASSHEYETGTSYFTHVHYNKGDTSVIFQTSTLAALLVKLPTGKYIMLGNYTGLSQGNAIVSHKTLTQEVNTVGILHNSQYFSKTEINISGKAGEEDFTLTADIASMTGGTNGALDVHGTMSSENCSRLSRVNGILINHEKTATLEGYVAGCFMGDTSKALNNKNLPNIFSVSRLAAELYLP
ncbi:uncharacterized protein [Palaemon carinicauda]|uniref:uncharacterized protein n=1 Tax=Palaemon carinicauda TaxID=392227 RepID=UPI0035B5ADA6